MLNFLDFRWPKFTKEIVEHDLHCDDEKQMEQLKVWHRGGKAREDKV
jgi:hypothetical protein